MAKIIDDNLKKEIIEKYKSKSIREIGSELHISNDRIKRVLVDNDITIKKGGLQNNSLIYSEDIVKLYSEGISINQLCTKYDSSYFTIKKILENNNIKVRSLEESKESQNVDNNFFSVIDTEEKAYILGLLYADGTISPNRKKKTDYVMSVGFKDEDRYLLDKIRIAMKSNHKIISINRESSFSNKKFGFSRISISSKQIYNDLLELGMDTKNNIPNISKELINHFVRGVFDGDGCISISKRGDTDMHIMGTENFLNQLNEYIGFHDPVFIRGIYRVRKSGKLNAMKFSNYIYNNSHIYLERKFNKFCCLEPSLLKTQDN